VPTLQRSILSLFLACDALSAIASGQSDFRPQDTLPRVAKPHVNFVTLRVADFDRAFAFYSRALGMRERGRAMPSADLFEVVMGFDTAPTSGGISLTYQKSANFPGANGSSSVNLVVRDLASILSRVPANGGQVTTPLVRGKTAKADYSLARVTDPDGNALELVEYHHIAR
jgi:predicted enzyme related to lactoylglutathione lyase